MDIRWPKFAFSAAEQLAEFSVDVQCMRVTCGKYYFAHSQPLSRVCTENQAHSLNICMIKYELAWYNKGLHVSNTSAFASSPPVLANKHS